MVFQKESVDPNKVSRFQNVVTQCYISICGSRPKSSFEKEKQKLVPKFHYIQRTKLLIGTIDKSFMILVSETRSGFYDTGVYITISRHFQIIFIS